MEAEQLANLHILHSYQPNHSPKVPVLRTIKGAGDEIKTMRDLEILLFSKLAMIQCAIFLLQNEHLPRYVRESPDRDQIFLRQFLPRITYLVDAVDYEIEGAKLDGNILFISNQEERLKRLKEVSPDTVSSWVNQQSDLSACTSRGSSLCHQFFGDEKITKRNCVSDVESPWFQDEYLINITAIL